MRKVLNLNITIFRGSDFATIIEVPGPSAPLNLTGYTFTGVLKSSTDPTADVAASFTLTLKDQSLYPGQVDWTLPAETSLTLDASISVDENTARLTTPYLYDILMEDSVGTLSRIIQGTAFVSPNVTPDPVSP